MEQIKTQLKAAFFIALVKLLLEIAAILCTLYSSYTGTECLKYQDWVGYRLFHLASLVLATLILISLNSAESPEPYDTNLPYLSLLKQKIKSTIQTGVYLFNPIRLFQSVWKGNDLHALIDILMLHIFSCLAATLALGFCKFREWNEFVTGFFLKPEILFPAASLLTLLRLMLLLKNSCFSNK